MLITVPVRSLMVHFNPSTDIHHVYQSLPPTTHPPTSIQHFIQFATKASFLILTPAHPINANDILQFNITTMWLTHLNRIWFKSMLLLQFQVYTLMTPLKYNYQTYSVVWTNTVTSVLINFYFQWRNLRIICQNFDINFTDETISNKTACKY